MCFSPSQSGIYNINFLYVPTHNQVHDSELFVIPSQVKLHALAHFALLQSPLLPVHIDLEKSILLTLQVPKFLELTQLEASP
jgi:hypothetical protein